MIGRLVRDNWRFLVNICCMFLLAFLLRVDLAVPLFLTSLALYLRCKPQGSASSYVRPLHLVFLFSLILAAGFLVTAKGLPVFYVPLACIPMLAAILFGETNIALLLALASTVAVSSLAGNDYHLLITTLTGSVCSIFFVRSVRRRMAVLRAGVIVGLVQAASLYFLMHFDPAFRVSYLVLFLNGVVSGFLVLATLPIFEYLFRTVTNISLLELADFNHPLLQRLMQEAPGTYHHSLIVGNLAEAACNAVGAHSLLARIGAYYHDVGKLSKPGYFSENLGINPSKHDALAPTMSKMVIMNHVKEGVDLARKHHLPDTLIDFIQRHHGSSLVYYFYRRALEDSEENKEVQEEVFRYPGPKPHSKETAIVLLADSVEAATRTLKEATPAKIEELVHKIINNKFIDGQLDECELSLKDLEKIAAVFIHVLSGIYHSRIVYPESTKQ